MRTNAMANHEYWQHPPAQSLTIYLHVVECPQKWFLLIHLHSLSPSRPRCPLSPLLASSSRPTPASTSADALRTHSSPSLKTTSKSGTNCKSELHCFQKHPHQLPVLTRHWTRSHQRGTWSQPLHQLYSSFAKTNDVANELRHGGSTYQFIHFLINLFQVWLICLPATSECILKDTLRKNTQVFLKFRDSIFEFCLYLINSNLTPYFLTPNFNAADRRRRNTKRSPAWWKWIITTPNTDHFLIPIPSIQLLR